MGGYIKVLYYKTRSNCIFTAIKRYFNVINKTVNLYLADQNEQILPEYPYGRDGEMAQKVIDGDNDSC